MVTSIEVSTVLLFGCYFRRERLIEKSHDVQWHVLDFHEMIQNDSSSTPVAFLSLSDNFPVAVVVLLFSAVVLRSWIGQGIVVAVILVAVAIL